MDDVLAVVDGGMEGGTGMDPLPVQVHSTQRTTMTANNIGETYMSCTHVHCSHTLCKWTESEYFCCWIDCLLYIHPFSQCGAHSEYTIHVYIILMNGQNHTVLYIHADIDRCCLGLTFH